MSVVERFKEISIFILVVFCGILLVPLVVLACLWKTIIKVIVSIFYKNLNLTFIGIIETLLYNEEPKDFPLRPKRVVLLNIVLEGQLRLNDARERIQKNAIEARSSNGSLLFLRLQQRLFKKLGYIFFGKDQNFNIANHIKQSQDFVNKDSIYDFVREQSSAPFQADSPLWEILLVPNYNGENKTFVLMRFHHLVMDGYSIVNFVNAISDEEQSLLKGTQLPTNISRPSLTTVYKNTVALPRTYLLEKSIRPITPIFTASGPGYIKVMKTIPLQKFKGYKKRTNVSLTEALVCATSFAMTEGCTLSKAVTTVACATMLPAPATGKAIGNNFCVAEINLPVESMTFEERLSRCQVEVEKARNAVTPIVNLLKFLIATLLPTKIFAKFFPNQNFFIIISNTPGPSTPISFCELYPQNIFSAGIAVDSPAINILPMSYNGDLTIFLSGLQQVFPSKENFEEFVDYLENALNTLLNSTNFDSTQSLFTETVVEVVERSNIKVTS